MVHPEGHYEISQGSELDQWQLGTRWPISVESVGIVSFEFLNRKEGKQYLESFWEQK